MTKSLKLVSIATAVPPYLVRQRDVAVAAHAAFADRFREFRHIAPVFESSGIRERYAIRPMDWYLENVGWESRNNAYLQGGSDLFIDAATKALDNAGLRADEVDTIVTVSSTGIATPSLEARVFGKMGFRSDVERLPVFGLGCAGGVAGLSIAARLAQSRPGSIVLLVAIELCTIAFRFDILTKANIVATALFGDGAAAAVLKVGKVGLADVEMSGQHLWPDTLDIMGWNVDPEGLGVIFDRDIPRFATENMLGAVEGMLQRGGLAMSDIDRFVCHPGGAKVVDALESAFSLGQGTLNHERDVLADYGNMSGPTVFFVLDRVIKSGMPQRALMTAMGPGFSANCVSLRQAA